MKFIFIILFFSSVQAREIESRDFFLCIQRTATKVENRTVRIHHFPKEKKCAVFYSVAGQDQMLFYGRWFSFCKNKAQQIVNNLQKKLWNCNKQLQPVKVFYSL